MRKLLISAVILGTLASAAPAAAQYRDYRGGYDSRGDDRIDHQIQRIEDRIRQAAQQRRISGREAQYLLRQAHGIDRLEDRYSRNGLSQWERQDLRNRVQNLRQQLRFERQDGRYDRRDDRGYDDRRDRWDD